MAAGPPVVTLHEGGGSQARVHERQAATSRRTLGPALEGRPPMPSASPCPRR